MSENLHRRDLLKIGAVGLSGPAFAGESLANQTENERLADSTPTNTLRIETFEGGPLVSYEFVVGGSVEKGPTSDANDSITDLGAQTRVTGEVGNGYTDNFYVESRPSDWSANVDSDHYRVLFNGTPINIGGGPNNTLTIETFEGGPLVSYEFVVSGDVDKGPEADANDVTINLGTETRVTGEVGNGYADDFYVESRPSLWTANVDGSHYRVLYNGTPINVGPDVTVETVSASPKSHTPRYVTFTGRVAGVPDGVSAAVGFEYQDYNAMWGETDTVEITAEGTTEFSITEQMPYIGRNFPYRAIAHLEGTSYVGDKQQVKVPNFIDTVKVKTTDVSVSGTTATVHGHIADFGKATTLEASAEITSGSFSDTQGIQRSLSTDSKQVSDVGPHDFHIQYYNLDPNTDYEARTLAKIPAGPTSVTTHGNVVEFTTGN